MLISIVVPCYNEQAVLEHFHARLDDHLATAPDTYEVLFVDDGSTDGTLAVLRRLAERDVRVRYLSFSRNFGKEAAMLAGLRGAAGDAIVVMDADLQHPPELLVRMVELHRQGYDQVLAKRTRSGDGLLRTATARLYYRLVNRFMDVEIVDGVGDFRLLSRRAVDAVLSLTESNRFSKGLFAWIGFPSTTFGYENAIRKHGTSKWDLSRLVDYGVNGVISFNTRPLRTALHLGLTLVLSAVLYALWIIVSVLVRGVDTPGYATLLTVTTALAGVHMVMIAVVGEYVGRIFHEVKRRPHYVLAEAQAPTAPEPDAATAPVPSVAAPTSTR
ncbi:glycosyltransferase family 2 protein [Streptomyces sp. MA15]|uniref:glycosyltransferase family 2 protein n=1 Tax=Streptomyces sp. MA15 TaxID=3055061 RepID=UPI0025AF528E|nr:glycosyltransferase family 2 protein [Streptomyces sp. MA15]MDN3270382.1 glycosyltransferase family 2 protein [Streptomyces sp. MA15]